MASGPITSWQIDEETVADFIFLGSKITADGDCSHEIKRRLLLGREVMTNLDSILKSRHYFANKGPSSEGYGFSSDHVWKWELDCEESWAPKNWCFWTMMLEKTLESPLDCKEIQSVHPKGDQSWVFIGRTDVEAEIPILWPPDVKSWLIGKDPDAGKDWGQKEKGTTEDEMVGGHHRLNGHGFGWTLGVGDRRGGLACCSSWGYKESDTTERLNWLTKWSSGFPCFLQLKSEFCNKEFMIWAPVSYWSFFCWLYGASLSSAAKNIINLISVLTIWWCPCGVVSCVVGRGCFLWPKRNQPWICIGRTDAEAEAPILWPPDGKSLTH